MWGFFYMLTRQYKPTLTRHGGGNVGKMMRGLCSQPRKCPFLYPTLHCTNSLSYFLLLHTLHMQPPVDFHGQSHPCTKTLRKHIFLGVRHLSTPAEHEIQGRYARLLIFIIICVFFICNIYFPPYFGINSAGAVVEKRPVGPVHITTS